LLIQVNHSEAVDLFRRSNFFFFIFVPSLRRKVAPMRQIGEQSGCCMVASFYVDALFPYRTCVSGLILLARHGSHPEVGQILSGRSEIALSDAGRAEANHLADRLAATPLAAVHSSPRSRARETAEIVAARHGLPVQLADALDEIDFGAWSGRTFRALEDDVEWQRWNNERGSAETPAGDTMASATARALAYIENLEEEGPVLCVSHCDIIRGAAAHYLGLNPDRVLSFDCDPASLTTLSLFDGGGRVVSLNERPA
jgi:broad specificity phosphatase PhoE